MDDLIEDVPQEYRERFVGIIERTDRFCEKRLNDEYKQMCREMAAAFCQPGSPVHRGKRESWASGIVHAVGWVNFLSDPSQQPYMRSEEIANGFGVSTGTMQAKSKAIRDALDITPLDPDFTLPSLLEQNPLVWTVPSENGLLVDLRHAPREMQEEAVRKGLIPYIPGEPQCKGKEMMENSETRSRYQHLRSVGTDLNHKLVRRLSRETILEGGKKLGLLRGKQLVLGSDDELPVLMDYCIFNMRQRGCSVIEQYLAESSPEPESDEMTCLSAMQQAVYSIFEVEEVERELGVTVRNLLSDETFLVADLGLARSANARLLLASRMLFFDGFAMTGGAMLPVVVPSGTKRQDKIERLLSMDQAKGSSFSDPAPIIRECLKQDASLRVRYE